MQVKVVLPARSREQRTGRHEPDPWFRWAAGTVTGASLAISMIAAGRQSYWVDELFSVNQSAASITDALRAGVTEIHPPLYAVVLLAWIHLGDTSAIWTRTLSAVFVAMTVPTAWYWLRRTPLNPTLGWALATATVANGMSVIYAAETRSYSLLLLGSVGLTAATLRAGLAVLGGGRVTGSVMTGWLAGGCLAASTHLFGAMLLLAAAAVLTAASWWRRRADSARPNTWRGLHWLLLAAVGCAPQCGWLLHGLRQPGFAGGTGWITAPGAQAILDLLTSVFSSGGLTRQTGGFVWTSPIGLIAVVVGCLIAAAYGTVSAHNLIEKPAAARATASASPASASPASASPAAPAQAAAGPAAALLLALAATVGVAAFGVSQWIHVWTLRNMIVVVPALSWGTICLAWWSARTDRGRRFTTGTAIALLGLGLVPISTNVHQPYKNDFRRAVEYLIAVRTEQPAAIFVFFGSGPPTQWRFAGGPPQDDPAWRTLFDHTVVYPAGAAPDSIPALDAIAAPPTAVVVTVQQRVADPELAARTTAVLDHLGAEQCRRIPIHGVGMVRCR